MPNPRLAARYAKSLLDLALERGQQQEVFQDMTLMQTLCKTSAEFALVLRSPVIAPEKKEAILKALTTGKISELTSNFNRLLIRKNREANLAEIADAFIDLFKEHEGIFVVHLATATPVGEEVKKALVEKINRETPMKKVELVCEVRPEIIGGFVLEVGDHQVDGSVSYELHNAKKQFESNDFIYRVR